MTTMTQTTNATIPVTKPVEFTLATPGFRLTQVPPLLGDKLVVVPIQIEELPSMKTVPTLFTVSVELNLETQPVVLFVNLKREVPCPTPIIIPELSIVATQNTKKFHPTEDHHCTIK